VTPVHSFQLLAKVLESRWWAVHWRLAIWPERLLFRHFSFSYVR
jgi:hypothetical protein